MGQVRSEKVIGRIRGKCSRGCHNVWLEILRLIRLPAHVYVRCPGCGDVFESDMKSLTKKFLALRSTVSVSVRLVRNHVAEVAILKKQLEEVRRKVASRETPTATS